MPKNVYMLLNLAHVELNAIDLAWDTVARFAHLDLPMVSGSSQEHNSSLLPGHGRQISEYYN